MKSILFLAWQYICYHKLKSSIMIASMVILFIFPLVVSLLLDEYDQRMLERSRQTPLLLGSRGNPYDLLLKSLYFRKGNSPNIPYGLTHKILSEKKTLAIPLHIKFTAKEAPLVGTTLDYFEFRNLKMEAGNLPSFLGEVVIGHGVSQDLNIKIGSTLLTDQRNLYDLAGQVPVELKVVGILSPAHSIDDQAVFMDIKTAWIIEGLGHGHDDLRSDKGKPFVQSQEGQHLKANVGLNEYVKITPENMESFHFHGNQNDFPITSLILLPQSDMERVILKTRYNVDGGTYQVLNPLETTEDLLGIVFRIKKLFDLHFIIVATSTASLMLLVVLLSLRLRARERETLHKLGCTQSTVFWLFTTELLLLLGVSIIFSVILALSFVAFTPDLLQNLG